MKLVTYSLKKGKYYRDNEGIEESEVKLDLSADQFRKLKREKEIRVRVSSIKNPNYEPKQKKKRVKLSKDDKLFEEYKSQYKITQEPYYGEKRNGISRLNRNGYWNFISWLDNEEEYKDKVIADIKSQRGLKKPRKIQVEDDDI